MGRPAEAERIARQILQIREHSQGIDAFDTIDALKNLAAAVGVQGDHAQAERLLREALSRLERNRSNQAQRFKALGFYLINNLALQKLLQGDPGEADKLLNEATPRAAQQFGPDHLLTLYLQRMLARVLAEEGQFTKAEALAQTTLDARRRQTSDAPGTGRTLLILARAQVEQRKLDQAELLLNEALTIFRERPAMRKDALAAQAANWLGTIQVARGAYPEAEALLLSNSDEFFAPSAEMSPNERRLAVGHIVKLYEAWDRPKEAAAWRKKLDGLAKP
jgi:predicted negative regulator of RcsB-dependent stress response